MFKNGRNCKDVLTLELPQEEHISMFLNHVWAFDKVNITSEDSLRNIMYHTEEKRKELRSQLSLDDFLKKVAE